MSARTRQTEYLLKEFRKVLPSCDLAVSYDDDNEIIDVLTYDHNGIVKYSMEIGSDDCEYVFLKEGGGGEIRFPLQGDVTC